MSNDPGLPGEGAVFLFNRYITHQELYATAGSREGQNGREAVCLNSPCTFCAIGMGRGINKRLNNFYF